MPSAASGAVRRFESCRGRIEHASENIGPTSLNLESARLPTAARMRQRVPRSDVLHAPYPPQRHSGPPSPGLSSAWPSSRWRVSFTRDRDVLQAGHAHGVGAHQDLHAVPRPGGDLDWRDARMAQPELALACWIAGPAQQLLRLRDALRVACADRRFEPSRTWRTSRGCPRRRERAAVISRANGPSS